MVLLILAFYVFSLAMIFEKAGRNGWFSLIPIYNWILLYRIANMGVLSIVLSFIPVIGIIPYAILCTKLSKAFGKKSLFKFGLFFFSFIFFPIIAFDDSRYEK